MARKAIQAGTSQINTFEKYEKKKALVFLAKAFEAMGFLEKCLNRLKYYYTQYYLHYSHVV